MPTTTHRTIVIDAPVSQVFDVVAHVERFSVAVPSIEKVEFLTDIRSGVGTRFEETRRVNGREGSTVLEVTEYELDEHVRIVSDAGGTIWDTIFSTQRVEGGTELAMVMEARPHTFVARLTTPLIRGMVAKGVVADLDAVKEFCESK